MRKALTLVAVLALMGVVAVEAVALPVTVYLDAETQGGGNKGTSFRPIGADFLLTARWGMDSAGNNDASKNPSTSAGLVFVDTDGTGVWAQNWKPGKKPSDPPTLDHGSDGISGGGPHGLEELCFTFDKPVRLDSIILGLVDIEFGRGARDKDDPLFLLSLDNSSFVPVLESEIFAAFTSTGRSKDKTGYVDFSLFTNPLFGPDAVVYSLKTRETRDHYEIAYITYDALNQPHPLLPEPTTISLLGLGILGVAARRRFRR